MTADAGVRRYLRIDRPRAKFVAVGDVVETGDPALGGVRYVSLYDERIEANVVYGPAGLILINNTYLPSFAYNLLLCWIYCGRGSVSDTERRRLIAHNFKKFYAEQLLHTYDGIFTRAIFLETLLYEQVCMVPVFAERERDPELDRLARFASELMASAVSSHELGHFILKRGPGVWDEALQWRDGAVRPLYEEVRERQPPAFVAEFQGDVLSVIACLTTAEGEQEEEGRREMVLRGLVFGYAAFAVLFSLEKSARATVAEHRSSHEDVDFRSIQKLDRNYEFALGIDWEMAERARYVERLCRAVCKQAGGDLYDSTGPLRLTPDLLDDLLKYVDSVMDSDDRNAREMSLLVAEALHGHPCGTEYLYMRSKTFDVPEGISL